jgi:hypothetical protein
MQLLGRFGRKAAPRGSRRRKWAVGTTALMVFAATAWFVASAAGLSASPSSFESADGNMTVEGSGATDWNCFATLNGLSKTNIGAGTCNSSLNTANYVHLTDPVQTTGDDSWLSGTKMDKLVCIPVTQSKDQGKDDFTDIASYNDFSTDTSGNVTPFLYGGTIRYSANGSASENVEFQQEKNGPCTDSSGNPITDPVTHQVIYKRSAGDRLLTIDYNPSKGVTVAFHLLTWIVDTSDPSNNTCLVSTDTPPCWGAAGSTTSLPASVADGLNSTAPIVAGDNGINGQGLNTAQFAEFGVNLAAAGLFPAGTCIGFARDIWESRASGSSFSSDPSDITIEDHPISDCQPVTIKVLKVDPHGNGLPGAKFELEDSSGNVLDTCTTGSDGTCSFAQQSGTGTVTYTVEEIQAPNGYNPGADQTVTVTFTGSAQTKTVTFTDNPAPGTINVHKQDPAGNPLQGAVFTLYTDANPAATGDSETALDSDDTAVTSSGNNVTCTTNSAGDCSFQQVALGDYWVAERLPDGRSTGGDDRRRQQSRHRSDGGPHVHRSCRAGHDHRSEGRRQRQRPEQRHVHAVHRPEPGTNR